MNRNQSVQDMTKGPIGRRILQFVLPLLFGNICQQLYNTVDAVVVGQFIGADALAAVGSSVSVINLLVGFFMGVSIGAGVVISRRFGENDTEGISRAVHTTVAFGLAVSVLLTVVGTILTPYILTWMDTPQSVLPQSIAYFRIFFLGVTTMIMYNIGSSIFRAMGDSTRPLYYLIISSCVNIVLDLLFVAKFGLGIEGAAWATIIAQGTSMALTFARLMRIDGPHRVQIKKIRFHRGELGEIVNLGLPSGLQNSIVSFSNVIVQSKINFFGAVAVAGCGAFNRVDGFAGIPISCFMMAAMTFISQNLGAREYERARKGAKFCLITGIIIAELMGIALYFFTPAIIPLFNNDADVISYGALYARNVSLGYFMLAITHIIAGILRGAGISKLPMFATIACWCGLRIIWITATVSLFQDIRFVFWGYPLTWACTSVIMLIAYYKLDWLHAYERKSAGKALSR